MYSLMDMITTPQSGIAPYGLRHSGEGVKGKGWMGLLSRPDGGVSSEISSEDNVGEFPLLVPTLSKTEVNHLLSGKDPTDEIMQKAIQWAEFRRSQGLDPFAGGEDIKSPVGFFDKSE